MSLPSRDYYLKLDHSGVEKFLAIKHGKVTWVNGFKLAGAFNFHTYDQAESFIEFLTVNNYLLADDLKLEVYRY